MEWPASENELLKLSDYKSNILPLQIMVRNNGEKIVKDVIGLDCDLYQFYHFNFSCLTFPKCAFLLVNI